MGVAADLLVRQAWQSAAAARLATFALLGFAATKLALTWALTMAAEQRVLLTESLVLMALVALNATVIGALLVMAMRGAFRGRLLLVELILQIVLWAVAVAVFNQMQLERTVVSVASVPGAVLVLWLSKPLTICLRPFQGCQARARRTMRELRFLVQKAFTISPGLVVVLYVFLTTGKQLKPAAEFAVMGVGMPLLQAFIMWVLAGIAQKQDRNIRKAAERRKLASGVLAVAAKDQPGSEVEAEARRASRVTLVIILSAKACYATGTYATLALAESDQSFYMSLGSMLCIEMAQAALHVKARHVVVRVVAEDTARPSLQDGARVWRWFLHVELGEKVGIFLALGLLAVNKVLQPDAKLALDTERLPERGLAIVLLTLVVDTAKDAMTKALGLKPAASDRAHVSLTRASALVISLIGMNAAFSVQVGLAMGR